MDKKLNHRTIINSLNLLTSNLFATIFDDQTQKSKTEKDLKSLTHYLLTEYGNIPPIDDQPTQIPSQYSKNQDESLIPKRMKYQSFPSELKKVVEFLELKQVESFLTLNLTEKLDKKNAFLILHKIFIMSFYTCLLNQTVKNNDLFTKMFSSNDEAALNFVLLQTTDIGELFSIEKPKMFDEITKIMLSLEKYLLLKKINSSESTRERFKIIKSLFDDQNFDSFFDKNQVDMNIYIRMCLELIMFSLDVSSRTVFVTKYQNSIGNMKHFDINYDESNLIKVPLIFYQTDVELSLLVLIENEEPKKKEIPNEARVKILFDSKKAIDSISSGINLKQESRDKSKNISSISQNTLNENDGQQKRAERSGTPKRVFQINNGKMQEKNELNGGFMNDDKDDKTDRTQTKYPPKNRMDSQSKTDSDLKIRDEKSRISQRSHSVNHQAEKNMILAKILEDRNGVPSGGLSKNSSGGETKQSANTNSGEGVPIDRQEIANIAQKDFFEINTTTPEKQRLFTENKVNQNNNSTSNFKKRGAKQSFFNSFSFLNIQISNINKMTNENTKVIQNMYKPLPVGRTQVRRVVRDSVEGRTTATINQMDNSYREKSVEQNPNYLKIFERSLNELESGRYGGNVLQNLNSPVVGNGVSSDNQIKVVRLNTTSTHQRQPSFSENTEQKGISNGISFRRLDSSGNQLGSRVDEFFLKKDV